MSFLARNKPAIDPFYPNYYNLFNIPYPSKFKKEFPRPPAHTSQSRKPKVGMTVSASQKAQQQSGTYLGSDYDDKEISASLVEETGVPRGNHRLMASN